MSAEWVETGATVYLVGAIGIFVVGCLVMGYIARGDWWHKVTLSDVVEAMIPPLVVAVFWPPILAIILLSSPVFVGIGAAVFVDFTVRTVQKLRSKRKTN